MTPTNDTPNVPQSREAASPESRPAPPSLALTPAEELQLQQLQQAKFWAQRCAAGRPVAAGTSLPYRDEAVALPGAWCLTRGIDLHDWQEQCVREWFRSGRRGVIKVVTGAGKTVLALAIAEKLQRSDRRSLRLAVVVPTIVLLNQWREEFAEHSNLPAHAIGLMGGGRDDKFSETNRVLICVLNSAAKKLPDVVAQAGVGEDLLLVVDECHRAGAAEMRKVFAARRAYSLGLSATPERSDDPTSDEEQDEPSATREEALPFEESILGQELGPVVFEMNYAEAIRRGVLPPFRIVHYGLSLGPKERERYDGLSRQIKDLRQELETPNRRGLALLRWCRSSAGASNPNAVQLLSLTSERKRLLYRMDERFRAVLEILRRAFAQKPDTKAILFHESIDEVMRLFFILRGAGYDVVAEHSGFPDAMRADSLRLFRQGVARVIVSARSLIEGFNVPSADLGIIVASSSSTRQRVQTLGRLLRRSRDRDGSEKQAILYVLYAADTVDELIYEKADWEYFVGADRNDYYRWHPVDSSDPGRLDGPPRRPPVDETKVDAATLFPGGPYPGDPNQGRIYSVDTQGTVRDDEGNLVRPNDQLRTLLSQHHRAAGRFRVTPINRYVTRPERTRAGWQTVYVGRLDQPLETAVATSDPETPAEYRSGDPYPLERVKGKVFSILQRDQRLIAKKEKGSVRFVVPAETVAEERKRDMLRQIQRFLAEAYAGGQRMSKITVTGDGHVVFVHDGQAWFVGHAPEGAEGFVFESREMPKT
jgi:superfamily II DNA or RNA helicase